MRKKKLKLGFLSVFLCVFSPLSYTWMTRNATVRVTQFAECFFSICAMCDWISVESADVGVESYSLFASRATYGLLTLVVAFLNFTQAGSDRFDFFLHDATSFVCSSFATSFDPLRDDDGKRMHSKIGLCIVQVKACLG